MAGGAGLSCLTLDMSAPGVQVRPLRQMSGGYHFNEVFLSDVFVPAKGLIGEPGGGSDPAHDAQQRTSRDRRGNQRTIRGATDRAGPRLGVARDPVVRQAVAAAVMRERILDLVVSRVASGAEIPAGGPVSKLLYSEHAR